jgi:DNA-binding MarR family transcriptional regulator
MEKKTHPPRPTGAAFLLAQLGSHAADRFGDRIEPLGITRPQAGILRLIAAIPACTQQALAQRLGVLPSRMVFLLDEMAEKGLVERSRDPEDRRRSQLVLTRLGTQTLQKLSGLAAEHEAALCAALTIGERETLASLCRKIAEEQGLTADVHPGFRKL